MSSDRGIDREYVIHVYNELLLSHKKDRNNAIFSNVDGHTFCFSLERNFRLGSEAAGKGDVITGRQTHLGSR